MARSITPCQDQKPCSTIENFGDEDGGEDDDASNDLPMFTALVYDQHCYSHRQYRDRCNHLLVGGRCLALQTAVMLSN